MPTIVAVAHLVASSGIKLSTAQGQAGAPTAIDNLIILDSISQEEEVIQSFGIFIQEELLQHEGATLFEKIINPSSDELTKDIDFIVFDSDLSRSRNLYGVIGVSGTTPKFFDRSYYFNTPSEIDPNTMRDLSEALQYIVYTEAKVLSYDVFNKTKAHAQVISVKGSTFASDYLSFDNIVQNGSFENGFGDWEVTTSGGGTIVIEGPSGSGATYETLSPPDGNFYIRVKKSSSNPNAIQLLRSSFILRDSLPSSLLLDIFFQEAIASNVIPSSSLMAVFLRFLNKDSQVHLHRFTFSGYGIPSSANLPVELRFIDSTSVLIGALEEATFKPFTAAIYNAIERESFDFDEIEVSFAWGRSSSAVALDIKLDTVEITVDLPEENLLKTTTFAHILTGDTVGSGTAFTTEAETDIITTDETAPLFADQIPAASTTFNDLTEREISFHIQDAGSDVDLTSVDVYINNEQVVQNGVALTTSTWPSNIRNLLSPNDVQYTLTHGTDFSSQEILIVSGTFADNASPANATTDVYQVEYLGQTGFTATISGSLDVDPPVVTPLFPLDSETGVSASTEISFRVTDNAMGVDPSALKFYINGLLVIDNDTAISGSFSKTNNSGKGFDYLYSPAENFTFGETISGTVYTADLASPANETSFDYGFTITPADTLEITNFFLGLDESTPLNSGTFGSVEVIDLTYGVASGTATIFLNGELPTGLTTSYSGFGPDRIIFTWPMEENVNFREDLFFQVHAENKFPGTYPIVKDTEYLLRPGYKVTWPNKDPSGSQIAETIFPYLTNVYVNTQVKNFAKSYNTASEFYRFLTENQAYDDLHATAVSNINTKDLNASLNVLSPYFAYGKEMTLEVEVADLEGNLLTFTHIFTIEDKP